MVLALPSRSAHESLAYLRLVPCACGETEFPRTESARREGEQQVKEYSGPCARCGTLRHFVFAESELPSPPPPAPPLFGPEGTTSTLLDPGQWLLLASRAARSVPSGADDLHSQQMMAYAVAALREVLHFLSPTAGDFDAVPAACFASAVGRDVLAKEPPGTFQKARLTARLAGYRRLLGRMRQSRSDVFSVGSMAAGLVAPSMPPPGSLVVVDRERRTLSFPTFVVGTSARAFLAAVQRAQAGAHTPLPGALPADSDLAPRTVAWMPLPLGVVRGYTVVLHLYGFDDPQLAPLLAVETCHARGVVIVHGDPDPAAPPLVLLPGLAEFLSLVPCPVVVFGPEALAAQWALLGGPAPIQRIDPAAGALTAFRAIGKAMLLAL